MKRDWFAEESVQNYKQWLKKQLQEHLCKGIPDSPGENIQNNTLKWVISLIDEEQHEEDILQDLSKRSR